MTATDDDTCPHAFVHYDSRRERFLDPPVCSRCGTRERVERREPSAEDLRRAADELVMAGFERAGRRMYLFAAKKRVEDDPFDVEAELEAARIQLEVAEERAGRRG